MKDWKKLIDGIYDFVGRAVRPLHERVKALEERADKNLADAYRGVWSPNSYERGTLITHSGSLWLALRDVNGRPGDDDGWRLIVKRGRDGKDGRDARGAA